MLAALFLAATPSLLRANQVEVKQQSMLAILSFQFGLTVVSLVSLLFYLFCWLLYTSRSFACDLLPYLRKVLQSL